MRYRSPVSLARKHYPRDRSIALLVGAWLLSAFPSHAQNEDAIKKACSQAYTEGQNLRRDGKLVEARNVILECAQERCPDVLQRDCMQWHDELRASIPSVVLGVRDRKDRDVAGATIFLDGKEWEHALDGTERALDPGEHVFRIEYAGQTVEERVLIRQGEKGRLLTFKLEVDASALPPAPPSRVEAKPEPTPEMDDGVEPGAGSSRATWGYALGGLGLVGLGVGGYFGSRAFSKWSERNDHCTDAGCDETAAAASDEAHEAAMVANIGAAVGVLGLGIGGYLLLSGDDEGTGEAAAVRAGVGTDASGAASLWLTGSW